MSMHPVEHVIYISSVLVHFVIPSHPVILLVHLYSRCLGPAFSHSGFEKLLVKDTAVFDSADFHHQLHHRFFECNYGTVDAPWDRWFGSFHDG
jgi:sterol desaturase/sphingolipid hydroxylase (fatty acid hydroxylase superfamily)